MIRRTELPDEITLPTGEILKPVIGGHLEGKPFLTVENSGVDASKTNWGDYLPPHGEEDAIIAEAKARKLKYRRVAVLSRNLRRSLDLRNQPYRPTVWIFVQTWHKVYDTIAD